jgi:hypothetical protein
MAKLNYEFEITLSKENAIDIVNKICSKKLSQDDTVFFKYKCCCLPMVVFSRQMKNSEKF